MDITDIYARILVTEAQLGSCNNTNLVALQETGDDCGENQIRLEAATVLYIPLNQDIVFQISFCQSCFA